MNGGEVDDDASAAPIERHRRWPVEHAPERAVEKLAETVAYVGDRPGEPACVVFGGAGDHLDSRVGEEPDHVHQRWDGAVGVFGFGDEIGGPADGDFFGCGEVPVQHRRGEGRNHLAAAGPELIEGSDVWSSVEWVQSGCPAGKQGEALQPESAGEGPVLSFRVEEGAPTWLVVGTEHADGPVEQRLDRRGLAGADHAEHDDVRMVMTPAVSSWNTS